MILSEFTKLTEGTASPAQEHIQGEWSSINLQTQILTSTLQEISGGQIISRSRTFSPQSEDRKSTRLNSSHSGESRMPSSA